MREYLALRSLATESQISVYASLFPNLPVTAALARSEAIMNGTYHYQHVRGRVIAVHCFGLNPFRE